MNSHEPLGRLALELGRLPGIGERTATRLAYYIVRASQQSPARNLAKDLAQALVDADHDVGLCATCQNLSVGDACGICDNPSRDIGLVCVVEGVQDVRAVEQTGSFKGVYHVLHGAISPLEGIGPKELKIDALIKRLKDNAVREVILATNANVEGDATALYLAGLIKPLGLSLTRLASGVPHGGELEYLDGATLGRALTERRDFH